MRVSAEDVQAMTADPKFASMVAEASARLDRLDA
jgi:hypothetical protein